MIKKFKNTVPWKYVINDPSDNKIIGTFHEKELPKTSQQEFSIEKGIKKKGEKLYVKWKGYDSSLIAGLIKKTYCNFIDCTYKK